MLGAGRSSQGQWAGGGVGDVLCLITASCEALSEQQQQQQRAARCIVNLHCALQLHELRETRSHCTQRACMEVPSSYASYKTCCHGQITQSTWRCMPDLGQGGGGGGKRQSAKAPSPCYICVAAALSVLGGLSARANCAWGETGNLHTELTVG
jgi:hypothetical protein